MAGIFAGRIAYCSVGLAEATLEAPFIITAQSGDFDSILSVEDPDEYTLTYTLLLKDPIPPGEAVYLATARADPTVFPGAGEKVFATVSTLTDTTIRVVTFVLPNLVPIDGPMALSALPVVKGGFDLVVLVKPQV